MGLTFWTSRCRFDLGYPLLSSLIVSGSPLPTPTTPFHVGRWTDIAWSLVGIEVPRGIDFPSVIFQKGPGSCPIQNGYVGCRWIRCSACKCRDIREQHGDNLSGMRFLILEKCRITSTLLHGRAYLRDVAGSVSTFRKAAFPSFGTARTQLTLGLAMHSMTHDMAISRR